MKVYNIEIKCIARSIVSYLIAEVDTLSWFLNYLGEEVLVDLSKENTKQYLMTRGAPEMENIMVCFSSRSLVEDKPQTYFSYSTTSYTRKGGSWKSTVTTEFKISSNENGHFLVSRGDSVV